MDEDYLEIEPPLYYSRDEVYAERMYHPMGGSSSLTLKYEKGENLYTDEMQPFFQ